MSDAPDDPDRATELPLRPSLAPLDAVPAAPKDLDSEPRRKWKPKPALLRALEAARKDLKPGEASLFWDWTATRDSVPAAEEVGATRGEALVSDKEAAAAYVAPVKVAPALNPRAGTRSRVRVRADLDPRKAPTVKVATPTLERTSAAPSRESTPSATPPHAAHLPPSYRRERRRRVAWAIFFGTVTGTMVFFWLRLPRDLGSGGTPASSPSASVTVPPGPPVTPGRVGDAPAATATTSAPPTATATAPALPAAPASGTGTVASLPHRSEPPQPALVGSAAPAAPATAAPVAPTPHTTVGAAASPPGPAAVVTAAPASPPSSSASEGFLIRKKGPTSP